MRVLELIWDEQNEAHISSHGVTPSEVEDVCFSTKSFMVRIKGTRYRILGQAESGRYLAVILDSLGMSQFYVVTARNATEAERRRLQRWRD